MIKELIHDPMFPTKKSEINTTIIKLVYKREFFDVSRMKIDARQVITITADGTVAIKAYNPEVRKLRPLYKGKCSIEDYEALCSRIDNCIENADRLDFYVDDSSEELKIFHKYGRVQIVDRGLGNKDIHIGDIMHEFLDGVYI